MTDFNSTRDGRPGTVRGTEPKALPPCPNCGGELIAYTFRGADVLHCTACPWEPAAEPANGGAR